MDLFARPHEIPLGLAARSGASIPGAREQRRRSAGGAARRGRGRAQRDMYRASGVGEDVEAAMSEVVRRAEHNVVAARQGGFSTRFINLPKKWTL